MRVRQREYLKGKGGDGVDRKMRGRMYSVGGQGLWRCLILRQRTFLVVCYRTTHSTTNRFMSRFAEHGSTVVCTLRGVCALLLHPLARSGLSEVNEPFLRPVGLLGLGLIEATASLPFSLITSQELSFTYSVLWRNIDCFRALE